MTTASPVQIFLTHGYFIAEDPREQLIMKPYPPLGLLYLSGYLKKNGVGHRVFDTTFSTKAKLKMALHKDKPKIIAFYVNLMTRANVVELIAYIRGQEDLKHTSIVIGGPEAKYNARNFLDSGANVIVFGEGEETFLELTNVLGNPINPFLGEINGIAFINGLGEYAETPERKQIKDLDSLLPNREAIDLHKYLQTWKKNHGQSMLNINSMRGCPFTCRWCSRAVYGLSYRRRSPESVIEEMIEVQEKYKPDALWFVDDVFTISAKWLEAFADEIEYREVILPYECISRADRMNEEVVEMLQRSGCFRVWVGAESGSQKILDAMDRRVEIGRVREVIKMVKEAGIEAGTFIMLGYPGETEKDIIDTVEHLKEANPDQFTITLAYPIRGTELFTEVEPDIISETEWATSSDRDIDFKRSYSPGFYQHAIRWVTNSVKYHQLKLQRKNLSIEAWKCLIKAKLARTAMNWELSKV